MINLRTDRSKNKRGVTSIEVVIGVTIAGIIIVYAMNAITQFINSARLVTEKTQALYLAEEGLELARYTRDVNWTNIGSLPLNTNRYFDITSGAITITTTPEVLGDFTRSFRVHNVYRNSSTDDIVASTTAGSVADSDTKYVTVTVSWGTPTKSVSLITILADLEP